MEQHQDHLLVDLISGSGTIDFLYTAASGNETANLLADVLTTEELVMHSLNYF